ncbi:MAG: aminopeptidase [Candidatus Hermodarchaeota archaeon]|nr:aminopeptidase [Candidatus Hermodarchaeota archaeon]
MVDERISKLAQLTVEYSLGVKKGDLVSISAPSFAEPLVIELTREILKAGGHPFTRVYFPRIQELFFKYAEDHQLDYVNPLTLDIVNKVDSYIVVHSSDNRKALTNVDPAKQARSAKAQTEIQKAFIARLKQGWYALIPYPSPSLAQEGNMGTEEYEEFVYSACLVDQPNPVKLWKNISKKQAKITKYLNTKNIIRFESDDVDLTAKVTGRTWVNADGHLNMPDGEVFTSPVEDGVEGTIRFSYPGIFMGKEVEDIALTFKKGVVTKATAAKGQDLLDHILGIDEGAKRLGEIAIGTNPGITQFTKNILFDEKLTGTIHCALGNGFEEAGGKNESAIHWDILADMTKGGKIFADDEVFYENGKFLMKVIEK